MTTATSTPAETLPEGTLTGNYDIDAIHSRIGFAAKHAMVVNVRGDFKVYGGEVYLDEENPANSRIHVTIDTNSVDTGNKDRDAHLRNPEFFNVAVFPTMEFTSTKVEKADDEVYTLIGDLVINGKTNPVSVDFELTGTANDPWGNFRAGFEGKTTVNRRDWGLDFNVALDKGGVLVGEKIKLEFDISAVRRVEQPTA
jgi:polyisoprenoid-binding protein YceI